MAQVYIITDDMSRFKMWLSRAHVIALLKTNRTTLSLGYGGVREDGRRHARHEREEITAKCLDMEESRKMGLRLFDWGGTGMVVLADSWDVEYYQTGSRKEWCCSSVFSNWQVSCTFSVDLFAMSVTLSLLVTDPETDELAPDGALLEELRFLQSHDLFYD